MRSIASVLTLLACAVFSGCRISHPDGSDPEEIQLIAGIGEVQHRITTSHPRVQRYFNQGLAFVYGFDFSSAARSFSKAAELDPSSPMAEWGLALALGPNYNASHLSPSQTQSAFDAIRRAQELSKNATAPERAYIAALSQRYDNDPAVTEAESGRKYASAMRDLARQYSDDPDAATLYAESLMDLHPWSLWDAQERPGPDTGEIISVLEGVLRRSPNHMGANHFYMRAHPPSR